MIVNLDVKSLEVVVAAWLSGDRVLKQELNDKLDIHGINQEAFGLPERVIAKVLVFRILYGGNEYSFVNDPDFQSVSRSLKYWKNVIDKFYAKYKGIEEWHNKLIKEVAKTSCLTTPFGRRLEWDLNKYGSFKVPVTEVKNYIVQGTGADIVAIARCSLHRRWKNANIRGVLVNTIHDSIVADIDKKDVDNCVNLFYSVFHDLPSNINRIFNCGFDLETRVEISVGNNMLDLTEVKI